jgi:hypothetical protein
MTGGEKFGGILQFWYFPFKQKDAIMFRMPTDTIMENQTIAGRVANRAGRIWTKANLAMAKRNARAELRQALAEDLRQQRAEDRDKELARAAMQGQ